MALMRSTQENARLLVTGAAMLVCLIALPLPANAQTAPVASIELVPVSAAGPSDTTTTLPAPLVEVASGQSFVVEVWARTDDSRGLSSVSTTILFDPAAAVVSGVIHTALFSQLPRGNVDKVLGVVTGLSGSHLSSCVDQVGVTPTWARVAILEMQAAGGGTLPVASSDTGLLALGTAVCGLGDLLPTQVAYGGATLTVTVSTVPTVSLWGVVLLALLMLSAGTVAVARRRDRVVVPCYRGSDGSFGSLRQVP